MSTINTRISEIISSLGIKKSVFAERLHISPAWVTMLCNGERTPSDRTIADICREFGVSQAWLVDGEGEMFVARSRNEEIALVVNSIMAESDDSFRKRFLAMICELSPAQWELLHDFIKKLTRDP